MPGGRVQARGGGCPVCILQHRKQQCIPPYKGPTHPPPFEEGWLTAVAVLVVLTHVAAR